jgi:anti-sigma factor RsiW
MNCDEKLPLVHALVDGELDVVHAREIEAHIAGCGQCTTKLEEIVAMKQRLVAPGLRLRAPASLAEHVALSLAATPGVRPSARRLAPLAVFRKAVSLWSPRLQGAFAGAGATMALAACLVLFMARGGGGGEIARSLVDGHLRSLAGEHLIDVQSTDRHTVKPWFAGKLDVTPPVPDLALNGFTLVGGRIDYVGGHAAAVVVYRRRTHVINLFVWPGTDGAPAFEEVSGYGLRHWTKDGLTFWAVSDINDAEFAEFEAAFKAAT